MKEGLVVGIDASRNRSGGAIAHICGLLSAGDPRDYGITTVHVWTHRGLRQRIADRPWLTMHTVPDLEGPILRQLWWQFKALPMIVKDLDCDVLLKSDAGSICPVRRAVTLSQDLLSIEPGERSRYGYSLARVRLELLRIIQRCSFRRARKAIFLTEYARRTTMRSLSLNCDSVVIPHGIDDRFRAVASERRPWPTSGCVQCLYISNVAPYKHQWQVVEAIARLRQSGYGLSLKLVGGGRGPAMERLAQAIARFDPEGSFVSCVGHVPNELLPHVLGTADLFVFASSCENLPVTLLEAMASGIPICSSNRGPMQEILGDDASYFDPERPLSIASAIKSMLDNATTRERRAADSLSRSLGFTWHRCANQTWAALAEACQEVC